MERELFLLLLDALRMLPLARRHPPKGPYRNIDVLAVLLWAALHDPGVGQETLIVDGRPLKIASHSADPDARFGRATGGMGKGYKLHEIVDLRGNCRCFCVEPLNKSEHVVARELVSMLEAGEAIELLADGNYDINALYEIAGARGIQLLTARRVKNAKGLGHHRHSEHRLRGLEIVGKEPTTLERRRRIESCFGTQGNVVGGLGPLPNFVRRLHRVRLWVAAKIAIDAAHRRRRTRLSIA